jgi:hypothetical protein
MRLECPTCGQLQLGKERTTTVSEGEQTRMRVVFGMHVLHVDVNADGVTSVSLVHIQ